LDQFRPCARTVSAARATTTTSECNALDWIRRWWRQPDHYAWLSAYLAARGLQRLTRYMIACIVALLGLVPLLTLLSTFGPHDMRFRIVAVSIASCCAVMALLWLTRWPTNAQSVTFAITANACIAVSCLAQSNPAEGIQGATAFVALAGYVAFFHTTRLLALTLLMATITATILAIQLGEHVGVALTLSKLVVLFVSVLAVPFSAQVLVHILGADALKSDIDPLTDLPNRRAFDRSVRAMAAESVGGSAILAVVMVDLDAFKRVNDTAGHAAGDQTLIAVAGILRHTRRGNSVTARVGGEEFVVAVVDSEQSAIGMAERLRREIAQTSWNVTASVGVATASLSRPPEAGVRALVQSLVESADRAMYKAKRAGGDQVYVVGRLGEGYTSSPSRSRTTATNGNAPWTTAERALSGDDTRRTVAAASIDPVPARSKAAPTGVPPEIVNPMPTPVTIARKRL
jgi:diguanylate cyclase (GGDEF)-like protein